LFELKSFHGSELMIGSITSYHIISQRDYFTVVASNCIDVFYFHAGIGEPT